MKKIERFWWIFTFLAGISAYLNPYIGLFSMVYVIVLFFDMIMTIIMLGHFKAIITKFEIQNEKTPLLKKTFKGELITFKFGKVFLTFGSLFSTVVVINTNIDIQKIMAPLYFPLIADNFVLQMLLTVLSMISTIFSAILYWRYLDSYKQKIDLY